MSNINSVHAETPLIYQFLFQKYSGYQDITIFDFKDPVFPELHMDRYAG